MSEGKRSRNWEYAGSRSTRQRAPKSEEPLAPVEGNYRRIERKRSTARNAIPMMLNTIVSAASRRQHPLNSFHGFAADAFLRGLLQSSKIGPL